MKEWSKDQGEYAGREHQEAERRRKARQSEGEEKVPASRGHLSGKLRRKPGGKRHPGKDAHDKRIRESQRPGHSRGGETKRLRRKTRGMPCRKNMIGCWTRQVLGSGRGQRAKNRTYTP
jgi:hypothetical protein